MTERDRAVSEVVGFTLVFGLVVTMVALVTVVGFSDLQDVRNFEQAENAERAFDVVADNADDVLVRGAPSRATELKLSEATVFVDDRIEINITANGSAPPLVDNATYDPRPIVYRGNSGSEIVYVAGAIFRSQRDGGRVVREPPFVLEKDRVFLPVAITQSRARIGTGGSTVRVRLIEAQRRVDVFRRDAPYDNISINVTSPRYELWEEYLLSEPLTNSCTTDPAANSVKCELTGSGTPNPNEVIIRTVRMDVELVQ